MVRSAAAVLAVLILPGFAFAQAQERSHTVVDDDTLWDLAQRYYSDPWEWRAIWEANRSAIDDPNLIYPGQVFSIPGLPADRTAQAPGGGQPPAGQPPTGQPGGGDPAPQPRPGQQAGATDAADRRTIFYRDREPAAAVVAMRDTEYVAVDVDQVHSAPFLGPLEGDPEHLGRLRGFALSTDRGSTLRQFHQVSVETFGPVRVGDQFRTFRVTRSIQDVGQVVTPTGIVTIQAVGDTSAVAVVTKEFARIQPGDMIGPLPSYSLTAGQVAQPVTGGSEAMIMGQARNTQLTDVGHHLFVDLGTDHGIGVGDEFVLYSDAVRDQVRGRLQVVSVQPTSSTVRIVSMNDDLFRQGIIVRLVRQMQ